MAYKNNVSVRVCGKTMTLSGNESVEYITKVANYIEKKAEELRNSDNSKTLNPNLISVLTSINIADDYFKEIEKNEKAQKEINKLKADKEELKASSGLISENDSLSFENEINNLKSIIIKKEEALTEVLANLEKIETENEELKVKISNLEEELKRQIAKLNHIKSSEHKLNLQKKTEKNITDNPIEIQEAILTDAHKNSRNY